MPTTAAAPDVDVVVIGAGVIGLAVARALALRGREVVIVERAGIIGSETSSRNSEVIHAGLYYPAGSLKARLCVEGRDRLYTFCQSHGVPHQRIGKLIVATETEQTSRLAAIDASARANGVHDLVPLSAAEARALEPEVRAAAALLSPSTGIIDTHAYMLALQGEAEAHGAAIAFETEVTTLERRPRGLALGVNGEAPALTARQVVNAAGHGAPAVARLDPDRNPAYAPHAHYAKGSYFLLQGASPFMRLVYPLPIPGGLGVHLTLDMAGQARFGPDVEWVDKIDYRVDPARADAFYAAIRSYWPGLRDHALAPGYAGVRPALSGVAGPAVDFRIDGPEVHGAPGLINLLGIESPGLTSSLALAAEVVRRFDGIGR